MGRVRALWDRYLTWRSTPGTRPPEPKQPISKADASDGDIISHATSNLSGGTGSL